MCSRDLRSILSSSNQSEYANKGVYKLQLNGFAEDFRIPRRNFRQIPDFHAHLFSVEHSLSSQQVNICGWDCKFLIPSRVVKSRDHNDLVHPNFCYKEISFYVFMHQQEQPYVIMKISAQKIFSGGFQEL